MKLKFRRRSRALSLEAGSGAPGSLKPLIQFRAKRTRCAHKQPARHMYCPMRLRRNTAAENEAQA
jgi:hypothetical protein